MEHSQVELGFSTALTAIDEAVIVIGSERRTIIACNHAAERMFGYSASEMCGRDTRFLHVDEAGFEEFGRRSEAELARDGAFRGAFRMRRKDGTIFDTLHTVVLLERDRGTPGGAASIIRDASEIESLRRRVQEAERQLVDGQKRDLVGRLAAALAHDLKNHLTVVAGNADFLMESELSDDQRHLLEEIRVSTEAAMAASRRLMSFVRPRDRREHERVDLNGTLRAAESIIRASAGRDTTVRLNLARGPAPVRMAAGSIEQIMVNLAINAWDAMPEGGAFTVRTEAVGAGDPRAREFGAGPGEYVLLTVEDTGCGMSEDVRTRLFEPFFTTKAERGTGLGLAAVDGLVRGAGGRIRVASEPGRGARFRILLPLAEAAPTGE